MSFTNKVSVVTGGSNGIGKHTAFALAERGSIVHIIDINEDALHETIEECERKNLRVFGHHGDVANTEEMKKVFQAIYEQDQRIDILVNNAGILRDNLLYKMSEDDWDIVMDVHLKGAFNCSKEAQSYMVEQGWGRIINLSSISALGNRGQANYATAKAGIQGFTKTLAIELGKYGITVNAVAPGFIDTDMTRMTASRLNIDFETFAKESIEMIPVRRIGTPEDVAHAVLFFADEKSSFVNGQILYVAGGPKT